MNAKNTAFALMMGALGAVLFAFSYYATPIAPSIAFDFSLIGVLIAGFYGGPTLGFVTGIFAGVLPGIMFGPLGTGGVFGLIGLPFGKALTGMTAGFISKAVKFERKPRLAFLAIPLTFLAYIPESIFTWGYFVFLLQFEAGTSVFLTVIAKALIEITIMSVLMVALIRNAGFSRYVRAHFTSDKNNEEKTSGKEKPEPI
jgi:LytS/YehU family sensor histidine kinase